MIKSTRLLIPLFSHSTRLCLVPNQILKRSTCSLVESIDQTVKNSQQSIENVDNKSDQANCKSISGQSIFGQKLIINGKNVPDPWDSLDCYQWPDAIKDYFTRKGLKRPTTIQSAAWPIVMDHRDLVGISTTGSGKTLAFILPVLVHVESKKKGTTRYIGPNVVILTPTRELAQQINQVFIEIGLNIPTCIFGGAAKHTQTMSLTSRQPTIIISTPGRLNEFIDDKKIDLSKVDFLVLDEADRMLELGLEAQIRRIIERMPKHPYPRQTLFFSATWPNEVRDLALDFSREFVQINVGSSKLTANPSIKQNFIFLESKPKAKEEALLELLRSLDDGTKKLPDQKILIFTATKKGADYLQRYLTANGFYSMAIHSDRPQHSRNLTIDAFRSGTRSILIGTDIASRGLDIVDISVVINFDMPNSVEDYVHRIGRTARSEASGTSYSLFMPEDSRLSIELVQLLEGSNQEVDEKLKVYAKLVSKQQSNRNSMGYQRYGVPLNKRIQVKHTAMTNYRRMIYK